MAEVWLAQDVELERSVALKLLTPSADRTRFEREARAAASLAHPNVTRVYDYGEADGRLFMALEYLPGGTLEERLAGGRPLPDEETAAIATQLAAGLAHAHTHNLVHRDVKPANVLFDDEGRPKLGDFGIARITGGDTITEAGTIMGTAAYFSPEQASGEPAGPASDVYAFGVLLYRMLTGQLPFQSESPLELAEMHRQLEPPAIGIVRPDTPVELAALAMDALAKDPLERPADGAALAARLGSPRSEGETTAAAPTVVTPRAVALRRRRAPLVLVVGALVLLGTAGVVAGVLATRSSSGGRPAPVLPATTRTHTTVPVSTDHATTAPTTSTTPTKPATTNETTASVPSTSSSIPGTTATTPTTVGTTLTTPTPGG